MTRATAIAYKAVFKYIEDNIFKLKPTRFMADFEAAMRKAITEFYPSAILHGCWFHFCAAIRKRALSLGFYALMKENSAAWTILKMLMCLLLLPADKIVDGFHSIVNLSIKIDLFNKFKKLFAYFNSYWLTVVCELVLFFYNI